MPLCNTQCRFLFQIGMIDFRSCHEEVLDHFRQVVCCSHEKCALPPQARHVHVGPALQKLPHRARPVSARGYDQGTQPLSRLRGWVSFVQQQELGGGPRAHDPVNSHPLLRLLPASPHGHWQRGVHAINQCSPAFCISTVHRRALVEKVSHSLCLTVMCSAHQRRATISISLLQYCPSMKHLLNACDVAKLGGNGQQALAIGVYQLLHVCPPIQQQHQDLMVAFVAGPCKGTVTICVPSLDAGLLLKQPTNHRGLVLLRRNVERIGPCLVRGLQVSFLFD
mmetsp:Transcript_50048/g.96627  ORF Transcript_50048/g.96627 Transcript_50048/m.96627 type:complete len:280 (-) Transcript_50048:152-991(-)